MKYLLSALLMALTVFGAAAQPLAPAEIPGKVAYIPFPVDIQVDGKFDDWKAVGWSTCSTSYPAGAPVDDGGSFQYSLAAKDNLLYIAFRVPDRKIVTGLHGDNWYDEDSFEIFTQFDAKRLTADRYSRKTSQIRVAPFGAGNTDPAAVSVTGTNVPEIRGYTVKTADGWAFEGTISIDKAFLPLTHGAFFGLNLQLNAAITKSNRESQVVWSVFDPNNNSWQQPKSFARGQFFAVGQTTVSATDVN
jgi:hypothetical protein